MRYIRRLFLLVSLLNASRASAQFTTTLQPRTVAEFDQYAQKVEQQLSMRWKGELAFVSIDDSPAERDRVMHGDLVIHPASSENPVPIYNGLVHDWTGAVLIPNTGMRKVLDILQNFDKHAEIYPQITASRLLRRNGNDLVGYWRLERKDQIIPVVLDVEQDAHYQEIRPGKWNCRAYANKISEVHDAGTPGESRLPSGEGMGFLWRLYAYWSLEVTDNGVLAECRTLSLSRSIPPALAWAIKPFIQTLPRESLAGMLRNTRTAATKQVAKRSRENVAVAEARASNFKR